MRRKSLKTVWMLLIACSGLIYLLNFWCCSTTEDLLDHEEAKRNKENLQAMSSTAKSKNAPETFTTNTLAVDVRWIVVFVPFHYTGCDVTQLSAVRGWRIVVVGGNNPPHGCRSMNCVFLTSEKMKRLGYSITKFIPRNSNSIKMIGYLYAISNGAKFIFDTECHIIPKFNQLDFIFSTNTTGLAFTGNRIFNPFRHFGYPMLYPRGFPANMLNIKTENKYRIVDIPTPIIQHKLTNFILQKGQITSLSASGLQNITFDRSSPPVFLSGDHYSPISSLNTLFSYDAFWLLVLPSGCKHMDCDIIRGYWAQRLLREVGGATGFLSSTSYSRDRTSHQGFVVKESSSKRRTDDLQLLTNWNCPFKHSVFQCARMLYMKMMERGYIEKRDVKLYDLWIADLKTLRYVEPPHKHQTVNYSYWNPPVLYSSPKSLISNIHLGNKENNVAITSYIIEPMEKICSRQKTGISQWLSPPILDIMLVVIFNYNFLFQNIPYIEFIHRRYFRHILYCGPKLASFENIVKKLKIEHVIFVEGLDADQWFYLYTCMIHAASMDFNVKGFLHVGDDILLNTWNILDLPRDHFWMQHPFTKVSRSQVKHKWWYYWNKPQGRTAVNRAMNEIINLSKTNPKDQIIKKFLAMYELNVGMKNVIHRSVDIFYLPSRFSKDFVHLAKIFRKHNVLLALAVTCIHAGLDRLDHVINLRGKSLWKENRNSVWQYFNVSSHYLHPFKAGKHLKEVKGKTFFCNHYLNVSKQKLRELQNKIHVGH